MSWGAILLELTLLLGLVIDKKYRKALLYAGLGFHFLILLIIGLFSFFFAIGGALIAFLWPIDEPIDFSKFKRMFSKNSLVIGINK